jgi:phosphate transport system permease protein
MATLTISNASQTPWKQRDARGVLEQLVVHASAILFAAALTALLPINGKAGFFIVWLPVHLVFGIALGRFGRRKRDAANSVLEVLLGYGLTVFSVFVGSVLQPVVTIGLANFEWNLLFEDAATTEVDAPLTTGGFGHAIAGTLVMVGIATALSVPIGILAALYVTEVRGKLTGLVRFFVQAMSGVPSIVAGLFIYAALIINGVTSFSGLSGALALSILMLPTVARTAEEILFLIPDDLRTAALALGGTQWRVVRMVVLPAAKSGLVTAGILGIARVAGETAPLLLTAFGNSALNLNPTSDSMSGLPLYIFNQFVLGSVNDVYRGWVAALVLMVMVGLLFLAARLAVARTYSQKR